MTTKPKNVMAKQIQEAYAAVASRGEQTIGTAWNSRRRIHWSAADAVC